MEGDFSHAANRCKQCIRERIAFIGFATLLLIPAIVYVSYNAASQSVYKVKVRQLEELTDRLQKQVNNIGALDAKQKADESTNNLQELLDELNNMREELNQVEFMQQRRSGSLHAVIEESIDTVSLLQKATQTMKS